MTTPEDDEAQGGLARRKLIRGAFAAPAAMTLFSGSASAAASNMRCIVTQNANPSQMPTTPTGTASADRYWRYQLWALVSNLDEKSIASYYVKGADLSSFVRNGQQPFLATTQWQAFDVSANVIAGNVLNAAPSRGGYSLKQVPKFVVLRVDANGRIVGAGSTGSGVAISGSCWTSFATSAQP